MVDRDDKVLRKLYREGFRISAEDNEETRLDRNNSNITVIVRTSKRKLRKMS